MNPVGTGRPELRYRLTTVVTREEYESGDEP